MVPALVLIGSYFLGALPFGLMIAKWWKGIDVREHGSGNIGATNVYRVVGKPAGVLVFVLDVLKGYLPPLIAGLLGLSAWAQVGAGFAAILGHNFSPGSSIRATWRGSSSAWRRASSPSRSTGPTSRAF